MSTLAEIRTAIEKLDAGERALLAAEFVTFAEPDANDPQLRAALDRGLADVRAGRLRPAEEVRALIPSWLGKS